MSFIQKVNPAPSVIPAFNIGCMLDIPTGAPILGAKGETIINGGVHQFTGQTGEANSAKTGVALFTGLTVLSRYISASLTIYDAETTLPMHRLIKMAKYIAPNIVIVGENGEETLDRLALTSASQYSGDEFYAEFKKYGNERPKLKADYIETPFIDSKTKKPISILAPDLAFIDSFSKFGSTATEAIQNAGDIGDSKQNTLFLKDGLVKTQMMNELPIISAKNGLYFIMTAQIGENKQLDPYKAPRETLSFLKNGLKLKRVPDEFRYNVHNLWFNFKMKPLLNQTTKAPEYPIDSEENNNKGDTDLMEITMMNLRGKSGSSGKPFSIIYSQSEGVKASLSEFHFIKTEGFGISGNNREWFLDLYPEVKLTRTTVRKLLDEDPLLRNAVKLTADLLQIRHEWRDLPRTLVCTPAELRADIEKAGYDWKVLLNTRSYWTFDQYTNPVNFLSIMDLLYMREGTYKPYWLK